MTSARSDAHSPFHFRRVQVALAILWFMGIAIAADAPPPLKTGRSFRQELGQAINVYRQRVRVREVVEQLAQMHGIAILLDRRIDPDRVIDLQLTQVTLLQGLE